MKTNQFKFALLAGLLANGCSSPGVLTARRDVDKTAKMEIVTVDGTYGLYVAGESQPSVETPLKKGQSVGFKQEDQGSIRWLYGVAGDDRVPLDFSKTYEWRREEP